MTIVVDGVGTSRKTPSVYIRVYPGTSGVGGTANKVCVLVGQKLAASGSMAAGEVTQCLNVTHAISLAGQGSELHLEAKGFFAANAGGSLYLGCLTAGTVASTRTITFAGGVAGTAGTYKVYINSNELSLSIPLGQAAADSATALIAAVQAEAWYGDLPCTIATGGAGVATLTTKNLGPQSQWALVPVYQDTSAMPTVQTATLAATGVSGGNAPTVTAVATTLGNSDYDYIGWSVVDSTATGAIETYVDTQCGPLIGYRQQMVLGSADSYAATVTMAQTNLDHRRAEVGWSQSDREYICETIGRIVGLRASKEDSDPAYPYNWEVLPGYRPHHSPGSYASGTDIENCLSNGITPIGIRNGNGCIVRNVTSYSRNGATPDYSAMDTATVTVPDYMADVLASVLAIRFSSKKCALDYAEPTDTPPNVVTPKMVRDVLFQEWKRAAASGIVNEPTTATVAQLYVVKNALVAGRIDFEFPVYTMEGLYIIAGNVRGA